MRGEDLRHEPVGLDFDRNQMRLKLGVDLLELFVKNHVRPFDDGQFTRPALNV